MAQTAVLDRWHLASFNLSADRHLWALPAKGWSLPFTAVQGADEQSQFPFVWRHPYWLAESAFD